MSMFDKLKGMLKGHEDQTKQGVEKAGDFVDQKTDNKYSGQADMAQEKLNEQLGDRPPTDEAGK
ncbi:antitoxin [Streptomyces sp. H10-C2]|uniref:antitoxin n=1 Tax=unclassified Streptomyces TaxID=2593676 RepID=UPI0024BA8C2F|nr:MULTISPECIES: antitoxin [unclassified Streptomyces]MDJ0344065.1 antitoxin [Streptomyces sp. PH10-H1]MDJ0368604.1 antitoxin [Streptomyces sp. H10-C2]